MFSVFMLPLSYVKEVFGVKTLFDLVVLDSVENVGFAKLVSIIARGKRLIVLSNSHFLEDKDMKQLVSTLPKLRISPKATSQDYKLFSFAKKTLKEDLQLIPTPNKNRKLHYEYIDAKGTINRNTGEIDSAFEEQQRVMQIIKHETDKNPFASISVVSLSDTHLSKIQTEIYAKKAEYLSLFNDSGTIDSRLLSFHSLGNVIDKDITILSLGISKSSSSRVFSNFFSLSQKSGEHALLQMLSKINGFCYVVSTLKASDLEQTKGVSLLKSFLHSMETASYAKGSTDDNLNKNTLLRDLQISLLNRGYEVHIDYKIDSEYTLPLIIKSPKTKKNVVVVTDNLNYIQEKSIRYANRLRMKELENAGWEIVPIWSVSLFLNPKSQILKIVQLLEN
jgi:hypothetical protein